MSKVLQSLDVRKSVGPDRVSPWVLKHCARQLAVPQGAIWSPLLFDLFIHNVPQQVSICLFHADDLTLQKDVDREQRAVQRAVEELNCDLQCLYEFGKEWLLEFDPTPHQIPRGEGRVITNLAADKNVAQCMSSIHGRSGC